MKKRYLVNRDDLIYQEIESFKDYEFTADIDGEILKEIDNQYIEKKDS